MRHLLFFILPLFAVISANAQDGTYPGGPGYLPTAGSIWFDPINGAGITANPYDNGQGRIVKSGIITSGIGHSKSVIILDPPNNTYRASGWIDQDPANTLNRILIYKEDVLVYDDQNPLVGGRYFWFKITPEDKKVVSLTNAYFEWEIDGNSPPNHMQLTYSINGAPPVPIGAGVHNPPPGSQARYRLIPLKTDELAGALQNLTSTSTVEFRIYAWGTNPANDANSHFRINEFEFEGAIDDALPVTFGNLQATRSNGNMNITWSTLTETNNDHFDVEVSSDGAKFQKIATVQSKAVNGTSSDTLNYQFSAAANQVAGLAVPALFALLAVGFKNRRLRKVFASLLLVSVIVAASCSKSDLKNVNTKNNLFVRIAQVDTDGTKSFSKIIKVVDGN
jgi:hypothetical protein